MTRVLRDPDPVERLARAIENLERRIAILEHRLNTFVVKGPRSDDPDGYGTRVAVGSLNGDFGVRVFAADGTLTFDHTTT